MHDPASRKIIIACRFSKSSNFLFSDLTNRTQYNMTNGSQHMSILNGRPDNSKYGSSIGYLT